MFLSFALDVFKISDLALIVVVDVIGGPAKPINILRPKHTKNAKIAITNSRLFIEYSRIGTERSHRS